VLTIGSEAPDFQLPGVDGRTGEEGCWRLSAFRGGSVVLLFYPGDSSPVCQRQLSEYTAGIGAFETLDATVLAVSHQSSESHLAFSRRAGGFAFPLLTDADKHVGRQFGVVGMLDLYRRCTYVIDGDGIVRYAHRYLGPGLGYRPVVELVDVVAALPASGS
jgi:thioredoxin-dependent peroxiredoxin